MLTDTLKGKLPKTIVYSVGFDHTNQECQILMCPTCGWTVSYAASAEDIEDSTLVDTAEAHARSHPKKAK